MGKKTGKGLSCLLVLAMVFTILPTSVFAAWDVNAALLPMFGNSQKLVDQIKNNTAVKNAANSGMLTSALATVTTVDLSDLGEGNWMSILPYGFSFMSGLNNVNLSNNNITDLTSLQGARTLQTLSMAHCNLFAVPAGIPASVTSLNLNGNSFMTIPSNLPSGIQSLDLSNNMIVDSSLLGLRLYKQLRTVDLSYNNITQLKIDTDNGLLSILNVANNKIATVDNYSAKQVLRKLAALNISNNPLPTAEVKKLTDAGLGADKLIGADTQTIYTVNNYPNNAVPASISTPITVNIPSGMTVLNTANNTLLEGIKLRTSNSAAAVDETYLDAKKTTIKSFTLTPKTSGTIDLYLCDKNGTTIKTLQTVTIAKDSVSSITIYDFTPTMSLGETKYLHRTILPASAVNTPVLWSSSNPAVLSVTTEGLLTGVGYGSAVISCTAQDGSGVSDTVTISVARAIMGITLSQSSLELNPNQSKTLFATVEPQDATAPALVWTSSDSSIAVVDAYGNVTALNKGAATITATTADGSQKFATCLVLVSDALSITLDQTKIILDLGKGATIKAILLPLDVEDDTLIWKTSNSAVVKVNQQGYIKAFSPGSVKITVQSQQDPTKTAFCVVSVRRPEPEPTGEATLNKTSVSVVLGDKYKLKAYIDEELVPYGDIKWTSSDKKIASVTQYGTIYPAQCGKVTIYAKSPDGETVYAKCSVSVVPSAPVVKVSAYGATSVKVTYAQVEGAQKYRVYMKEKGGRYQKIADTANLFSSKYGMKANTAYSFKVRAYTVVNGKTVYSAYSKPVTYTVPKIEE